ncbi:MAG: hypothetical protein ACTSQI_10165 [Candidatus Helarchaeota archaeon]
MKEKMWSKWIRLIIGIAIASLFPVILIVIGSSGTIDITAVLEYLLSPLLVVIILELAVFLLFIYSFLFKSKRWKRILRISALFILFGLMTFYFIIPILPVHMSPNHPDTTWDHGEVVHILPTISDNRILLKASFESVLTNPLLDLNGTVVPGIQMDTQGYFWCFDAQNLSPSTIYQLRLERGSGVPLCDPWPLKTFPLPNTTPEHLRILVFTGSGGHDACRSWYGMGQIPLSIRQKLLNKALSLEPDIIVSTGDQVYYDIRYGISSKQMGDSRRAIHYSGRFDPLQAVLGTENENVLKRAVGPQIAYLYGTACRSIPTFFILDDHDYFCNDDAIEKDKFDFQLLLAWMNPVVKASITFPPDNFSLELGRAVQKLYLPEFLPDPTRPVDLPSSGAVDRPANVSECFGSLRYGNLVESVLYDVRRYVTLDGFNGTFIPPSAEEWIIDRMVTSNATYMINFSPISVGWSCGKWLSWYPDVKTKINGKSVLTTNESKYMWQKGWFRQHNRILNATLYMQNTTPLFVCGDMHTQTAGLILQSSPLNFSAKPIPSVLCGALGVDGGGFPSGGLRGIEAIPPNDLEVIENLSSHENAGFIILDITQGNITIYFYGWTYRSDSVDAIATLSPYFSFVVKSH